MPRPDQIWSFLAAVVDLYHQHGGHTLPLEEVKKRFEVCKDCEHFTGRGCKLCGCCTNQRKTLFNKLAFPNQSCPAGKWLAVEAKS